MTVKKIISILLIVSVFTSCNKENKEYISLLKTADSLYIKNEFKKAKVFYEKALKEKPSDIVVLKKITEINNSLIMKNKEEQYNKVINIADDYFEGNKYKEAKKAYLNASKIMADEKYPKNRIQEIDLLIAQIKQKSMNSYHIIVGSFKVKSNAIRLNKNLISKGFKSFIIPRFGGVFNAVSYTSHPDIHDAFNHLKKARVQMHPDSWVLHQALDTK